jgi:hypothetical protein
MLLLENHNSAIYEPGKSYLIVDHCNGSYAELQLVESSDGSGRVRFRGKFQEADAENKNKRIYPFSVLDENVKKLGDVIGDRRLVGELDHPTDSILHFANASHLITKLWWEGNTLMGEGEILNTPHGKVLKALISDGVKIGISSRGVGNGKVDENGVLVISENYKLITFDVVADPSCYNAFQEKISNTKKESAIPTYNREYSTKNENTSIHRVSKEALIACLGGLIQSGTRQIKSRLK